MGGLDEGSMSVCAFKCVCVCVCLLRQLAEEAGHVLEHPGHGGHLADFGGCRNDVISNLTHSH